MLGAFLAQDLALFVVFFDLMLVPFLFLSAWGGPDRAPAAMKMIIYTLVGSLLMLAAAVATAVLSRATRRRAQLRARRPDAQPAAGAHAAVALRRVRARVPDQDAGVPVPRLDAGRVPQMPLPALAVFSGVLSKVAAYGFLRLALPLFPAAAEDFHDDPADPRRDPSSTARRWRSRRRTCG